jgi:hypothetical protein
VGTFWGGRKLGLYNRGGMRMNWWLMHQQGVGHPCNVDGSGTATCGHTGVGSMFPNRNAQIGYATPEVAGLQLSIAMFDPAMINADWNRTPLPRVESELTFRREFGGPKDYKNEINAWANGLSQPIGRTQEVVPAAGGPSGHSGKARHSRGCDAKRLGRGRGRLGARERIRARRHWLVRRGARNGHALRQYGGRRHR